jgi:hypothetical protein
MSPLSILSTLNSILAVIALKRLAISGTSYSYYKLTVNHCFLYSDLLAWLSLLQFVRLSCQTFLKEGSFPLSQLFQFLPLTPKYLNLLVQILQL